MIPDYVRFENMTDIWMDRSEAQLSAGRNIESRSSMQNMLFVSESVDDHSHMITHDTRMVSSDSLASNTFTRMSSLSLSDQPARRTHIPANIYLQFEMLLSANEELFKFKRRVIQEIKNWPFFYDDPNIDPYVSERVMPVNL